jgi:hypothetical protein
MRAPVSHPTAEDRQWRQRRRKCSRSGGPLHGLRIRDLETIYRHRYGGQLPDDDAGRGDAMLALHHLAGHALDPRGRMLRWLSTWAPWFDPAEAAALVDSVLALPLHYRADTLADRLNLNSRDRAALGVTTIGATDLRRDARKVRRRERARKAKQAKRRAAGARPRAEYERSSASKSQPWKSAGMSRATWYRNRQRPQP